jgi:uncharacterized protein DUF2800
MATEERAHAALGASSMSRWEKCPASLRLAQKFPNSESAFAAEGTLAHKISETCLWDDFRIATAIGVDESLPDDMLPAVQVYLDAVYEVLDAYPDAEVSIEQHFSLDGAVPDGGDMFGTNDASIYVPSTGKLFVFDYKHGAGVTVEVKENPQLLYYALGAAWNLHNRGVKAIELIVVQPRVDHRDGPVRAWSPTINDMRAFRERLIDAVARARDPKAPFAPGRHCLFCPAAGLCAAQAKRAFSLLEKFGWSINRSTGHMVGPLQESYGPDELAEIMTAIPEIRAWVNRASDQAARVARTEGLPRFKFVKGRKSRSFKNETVAASWLIENGVDPDDIRVEKMVSVAQAEKIVKRINKGLPVQMAPLVNVTHSSPILVPDSDPRDALESGPDVDFDSIEGEK